MRIIIDEYGTHIGKCGDRFVITTKEKTLEKAARDVSQIILSTGGSITTDAILLAAKFSVDLLFVQRNGSPEVRLVPHSPLGVAATRRAQYQTIFSNETRQLTSSFITGKILNMGYLLQEIGRTRNISELVFWGKEIRDLTGHLSDPQITPSQIRGVEGIAARYYFSALGDILPPELYIGKRQQHPATDIFNMALNYGYSLLASEIERMIIQSGLDPSIGFLHSDRSGRSSLVYDFIEEFRQPVVDRAVITLISRKQLTLPDLECANRFTRQARQKLFSAIMHRMDVEARHQDSQMSVRRIIEYQIRSAIRSCQGTGSYTPYIQRWH